MLCAGWRSCIAGTALLMLAACGGGSSNASTTISGATATASSTSVIPSSPTSTSTQTPAPSPTATPAIPATPTSAATPLGVATPAATPGAGLTTGSPTPQPTNQVQAQLASGVTSDYEPVDPGTTFSTSATKVYLVFSTTDLPENSSLDTVWIAVKVNADVPDNYEIDKAHLDVHGSQAGDFSLTAPGDGFPAGSYRVDLYLNGTLIGSYPYEVK